jgi:RimJ/RimL family protein N-acetyltransferase
LIRPATLEDVEALGALWDASARAAFAPLLPPGHPFPDPQPDRMREAADRGTLFVAEQSGELAGFVAVGSSRDPDPEPGVGEVRSFFVAAGRWRRGIGRELMAAGLAGLEERGYEQAIVWSFADNERANAFYERQGFARDGATRTEVVWALIPEVRYRRTLP